MEVVRGIARRDFLKGVAAAALTAGFIGPSEARAFVNHPGKRCGQNILPKELQPHPEIHGHKGTEHFWSKVRKTFVLDDDYIHMNTGTTGSQPLFSLVNLGVYNLYKSMDPRDWQTNLNADFSDLFPFVNNSAMTARQTSIAAQYGANPDEIVLSYNTTDACNLIFAGTPWKAGDRIVCAQWEHNALAGPIAWARDYFGVEVKIVDLPTNFTAAYTVGDVLSIFQAELSQALPSGAKQYLATSEVFYKNGLRLPVKEICQLAQSYGAFTIIDSAHGWGQLPVNCHDYEADFICGAGHKWLCGGPGTGIFYIRKSYGTAPLPPFSGGNWGSYGNIFTAPSSRYDNRNWAPTGIQGRGETNTPALYAMSDSAAYFNYLGVQDIYTRSVMLGNYLKAKIAAKWGPNALFVQQNPDPRFATGLTAFNPFAGKDDSSQYAAMREAINGVGGVGGILNTLAGGDPKIYIRSITFRDKDGNPNYPSSDNRVALRVSTHGVYNNYREIDHVFGRLVAAVDATGLPQLG